MTAIDVVRDQRRVGAVARDPRDQSDTRTVSTALFSTPSTRLRT